MKSYIACVILLFAVSTNPLFSQHSTGQIQGLILDSNTNKPLDYVNVFLQLYEINQGHRLSDDDGKFDFRELSPGSYKLVLKYPGYAARIIEPVNVKEDSIAFVKIKLNASLNYVMICGGKPTLLDRGGIKGSGKVAKKIVAEKSAERIPNFKGSRTDGTAYYMDAKSQPVKGPALSNILTAGEINDFSKWDLWKDITGNALEAFQNEWQLNLTDRYPVQVVNKNKQPIADCAVKLIGKNGNCLWEARTDNTGKAELWTGLIPAHNGHYSVIVTCQSIEYTLDKVRLSGAKPNVMEIAVSCNPPVAADIAFVVDATSSMDDEIKYLKDELSDVMSQVNAQNPSISFRFGSVFYRDHDDEYLVRRSDLDTDFEQTNKFIAAQNAWGGGDRPEAVDDALDEAINRLQWRKEARSRLLILLLDAPPHQTQAHLDRIHALMVKAAAAGIRIIPVVSSGIDKSCEYLMRCMALATNGTYVFLTDHSGVGNSHIIPTTDSYDVKSLNSILKQLISQYNYMPSCNLPFVSDLNTIKDTMRIIAHVDGVLHATKPENNAIVLNDDSAGSISTASLISNSQSTNVQMPEKTILAYYPNPNEGIIHIEISGGIKTLYFADITGKLILQTETRGKSKIDADLSEFSNGTYFIKCEDNGQWLSGKIIVAR